MGFGLCAKCCGFSNGGPPPPPPPPPDYCTPYQPKCSVMYDGNVGECGSGPYSPWTNWGCRSNGSTQWPFSLTTSGFAAANGSTNFGRVTWWDFLSGTGRLVGIKLRILVFTLSGSAQDCGIYLTYDGAQVGDNKAGTGTYQGSVTSNVPEGSTTIAMFYGGDTDLWGTSGIAIQQNSFGIDFAYSNDTGVDTAIRIRDIAFSFCYSLS